MILFPIDSSNKSIKLDLFDKPLQCDVTLQWTHCLQEDLMNFIFEMENSILGNGNCSFNGRGGTSISRSEALEMKFVEMTL